MTQNQATESPIDSARKAVAYTRADKTAKESASRDASIALDLALSAVKAEGTPAARKGLTAAEQTARYSEIELQGATERHTAATDNLANLERESKLTQHASRARSVGFESFSSAASKVAQKVADARARLVDAEAEGASIVRGFATEAETVRSEGAGLGAALAPQIDYSRVLAGLVAKAAGLPAAAILASIWATTAPAGVSPEAALVAVLGGLDPRRVASLVAALRDSTSRAAVSAKLVVLGHLEATRGADKTLTACARFSSALAESKAARVALTELGLKAAADAVKPDALSEKLDSTGAEKVHAAFLALRMVEGLTAPGYPTPAETKAHQDRAAAPIVEQITALGFGEFVEAVRPSSRAHGVTHTSAPGPVGFVNVGAVSL